MTEDYSSISSSRLSAAEVTRASFAVVRRGFDPREVRSFLDYVARELESFESREAEMRRQVAAAEERAANPVIQESDLTAALGTQSAEILRTAHAEAAQVAEEAQSQARQMIEDVQARISNAAVEAEQRAAARVGDAEVAATTLTNEAAIQAERLIAQARADGETLVGRAREQGRAMIEQAQEVRAGVLADMNTRRRTMHLQIEQLRAARDELARAVVGVRDTVDRLTAELASSDAGARAAAEEVARRQPTQSSSEPEPVEIDGQLDDWRLASGFAASRDGTDSCPEWVDGRMMYDDGHLYIAAHVGDPAPMQSSIDPAVDPDLGWRGGSVQVRVSTDRQMGWPVSGNSAGYYRQRGIVPTDEAKAEADNPKLAHLTMWFHAASQTPCLTIARGMLVGDLEVNPSAGQPGGFRGAFTRDADGKGYILEYAIPWRLLNCESDPPRAGDELAAVWQVYWSDDIGRLQRQHMVEIRNSLEPREINVWERGATWGRAEYR